MLRTLVNLESVLRKREVLSQLQNWQKAGVNHAIVTHESVWETNNFIHRHFTEEETGIVSKHKEKLNMMSQNWLVITEKQIKMWISL